MQFDTLKFKNQDLVVPRFCRIPVIPGDGIGPEIWNATERVIDHLIDTVYAGQKKIDWKVCLAGEAAFKKTGHYLPEETLNTISDHLVTVKGPLTTPVGKGIRSLNVHLRKQFDLYACVRPIIWFPGVKSPVQRPDQVDMVIFRENTEDIYVGIEWDYYDPDCDRLKDFLADKLNVHTIPFEQTASLGIKPISKDGTQRLVHSAIDYAIAHKRSYVTLVHKGNIMKFTEGRFRDWGYEIGRRSFGDKVLCDPDIDAISKKRNISRNDCIEQAVAEGKIYLNDCIADNFFQQALINPAQFSVVACPNLNGDFISDALAAQVGGLGLSPGANINYENGHAIFEATHGSAPDIVGTGQANPTAMLLSVRMLLLYMKWDTAANILREAIKRMFREGHVTADLNDQQKKKPLSTDEFAKKCCDFIT